MEVPTLVVAAELELPAKATATATWDLSNVCNLHHSSWQCRMLNPLSEARDQTHVLMGSGSLTSEPHGSSYTVGTPILCFLDPFIR